MNFLLESESTRFPERKRHSPIFPRLDRYRCSSIAIWTDRRSTCYIYRYRKVVAGRFDVSIRAARAEFQLLGLLLPGQRRRVLRSR